MITEEQLAEWARGEYEVPQSDGNYRTRRPGPEAIPALIAEVRRLRAERDTANGAAEAMKALLDERDAEGRKYGLSFERVSELATDYALEYITIGKLVECLRDGLHAELERLAEDRAIDEDATQAFRERCSAQFAEVTRERDALRGDLDETMGSLTKTMEALREHTNPIKMAREHMERDALREVVEAARGVAEAITSGTVSDEFRTSKVLRAALAKLDEVKP